MQLDRTMLARLLAMNDAQLETLVRSIAKEADIDPEGLGIKPDNIKDIREALSQANDSDLLKMTEILDGYQAKRKQSRENR